MKVVFCLGSLNKGGAERVVCNLANYFVAHNDDVSIVITKPSKKEYFIDKRVKVFVLDRLKQRRYFKNFRRLRTLRSIIAECEPDVIFGFLQEPIARLLILKTFCRTVRKIPTIISVRVDPKIAFDSIKQKICLCLYNKSEGYVFQTEEARKFFNKAIQNRGVVIANPVDSSFFSPESSLIMRDHRIVAVGRLVKQKNYPMLIDAFSIVHKKLPEYTLEIFGDGPLRAELSDYIIQLGLRESIALLGNVDDIKDRIKGAAMFVITSNYEGMSNALMEAMALGIPSISTNSTGGGASSLIRDGKNGFLVDVGNVDELADKMIKLLSNEELQKKISVNSTNSMLAYGSDRISAMWYNYARRICKGKKNGKR